MSSSGIARRLRLHSSRFGFLTQYICNLADMVALDDWEAVRVMVRTVIRTDHSVTSGSSVV